MIPYQLPRFPLVSRKSWIFRRKYLSVVRAAGLSAAIVALTVLAACSSSDGQSSSSGGTQVVVQSVTSSGTAVPAPLVTETSSVSSGLATVLPMSVTAAPIVPLSTPPSQGTAQEGAVQDGRPLIARVNGQPIYLDVYQKQVEQTEKALVEQGIMAQGDVGDAQRAQLRANVLQGLIDQVLIEQAAAEMGITVDDSELEQSLSGMVAEGTGSIEQWLAANNMTMEELRAMQRAQLLASKVIAVVSAAVPTVAEQVHARHIFTVDQAKGQALLERIKRGENFAALAQRESEDASTSANGGDLGWFPRDAPLMPLAVVQTAFALSVGEVSQLVQSEAGYHIVKVEAREENRPLAPEMLLYAQQNAFQAWLAERRARAVIEHYQP